MARHQHTGEFLFSLENRLLLSAQITGTVFNDANANGQFDGGEAALSGRLVYLDLNDNGLRDENEPTQTPGADGKFAFANLSPGTYAVAQDLPLGWTQTCPASIGPELRLNAYTNSDQRRPDVACNDSGAFVSVWSSLGQDGSDAGIFGQLLNVDGTARGVEFRVSTYTAGYQGKPQAAMAEDGSFVVVWQSDGQDGSGGGIYGQLFNADGSKRDGEFRVNTTTAGNQIEAGVAMDDAGDFAVVWQSENQDGGGWGVYGQRYNASGSAAGSEFLVNTTTADDQISPEIGMDASGGFVVAWTSRNQDGDGDGIYAKQFKADGSVQVDEFLVNQTTAGSQYAPSVAMNDGGQYVVAWTSVGQDGSGDGVFARQFPHRFPYANNEFQVNTTTAGDQSYPAVAIADNGNFGVFWQSQGQDGSGSGVCGQYFASDATRFQGEFQVNAFSSGNQEYSAVAATGRGRMLSVYESAGFDGSGFGVAGRMLQGLDRSWVTRLRLDDGQAASLVLGDHYRTTRTWYVDDVTDPLEDGSAAHPFDSIQQAIDAAGEGDTVIVNPGSYNENPHFKGKNINVQSTNPNDPAVVAATHFWSMGNQVVFAGTEGPQCRFSGFTMPNDMSPSIIGNGALAEISHNTITAAWYWCIDDCDGLIQWNTIQGGGDASGGLSGCDGIISHNTIRLCGLAMSDCDGIIETNTIDSNGEEMGNCGGLSECDGTVRSNYFHANFGWNAGAAENCAAAFLDNVFDSNSAWYGGGALAGCTGLIQGNVFTGNFSNNGGAIYLGTLTQYSTPDHPVSATIRDNVFIGNSAQYLGGGAIYLPAGCTQTITNCIFANNYGLSDAPGGAIMAADSGLTLVNCTISGNTRYSKGSPGAGTTTSDGIVSDGSSVTAVNCIVTDAPTLANGGQIIYRYSDVLGSGGSGAGWKAAFGTDGGGNLDANPQFVNAASPAGADGKYFTPDDGLALKWGSSCIDAGDGAYAPALDILGLSRVNDPATPNTGTGNPNYTDMGAYEYDRPGDANRDGKTSFADYIILANNFGQAGTWNQGDFNGDGKVTFADYIILANNFGVSSGAGTSTSLAASTSAAPTANSSAGAKDSTKPAATAVAPPAKSAKARTIDALAIARSAEPRQVHWLPRQSQKAKATLMKLGQPAELDLLATTPSSLVG